MKLRNKKTGEIIEVTSLDVYSPIQPTMGFESYDMKGSYSSLAELNKDWEDYEEPKEYWYIDYDGGILCGESDNSSAEKMMISMGNHFETIEEAEKAVEKLKAWKRLKDKGFKFGHIRSIDGVSINHKDLDQYTIIAYADEDGCDQECLALIFGGGE